MVNGNESDADDEDVVRHGVVDVLKRLGCSVTDCVDGDQTITALKEAHAKGNSFDLVISDIRMPGHNGYEVFRTARDIDPSQSVILMTGFGYDPHHSIMRASQDGMQAVLFKPFRTEQLIDAVCVACRKKAGC